MKESLEFLEVQNRSVGGSTSASHTSPSLELIEHSSPVSFHESDITPESAELPSSFYILPNNYLRIKYFQEKLRADCFPKRKKKTTTSKKGTTKKVFKNKSKRYIKWQKTFYTMFEELKEYKRKHGHCNVEPKKTVVPGVEYSHLSVWVSRTRDSCKKYLAAEDTSYRYMDEEKMQLLKDIGFDMHTDAFSRRVRQLERFKEKYGHLNVPVKGRYGALGRWCCLERSVCRDFEAGKTVPNGSIMTSKRLEILRKIGFDWSTRHGHPA